MKAATLSALSTGQKIGQASPVSDDRAKTCISAILTSEIPVGQRKRLEASVNVSYERVDCGDLGKHARSFLFRELVGT